MTPPALLAVMDATWAPSKIIPMGPWLLREGLGGGKRVSAATTETLVVLNDVISAETAMQDMQQIPLFMIQDGNQALDKLLETRGYRLIDPVIAFAAPCADIAVTPVHPLAAIEVPEPLAIMAEIWARGGISAARLQVMARVQGPKISLLNRRDDDGAGGCAFVACHDDVVMVHALEVLPESRRLGVARKLLTKAAFWGQAQGAKILMVVTTGENLPAQKLFKSLGMHPAGSYHYRIK